MKLIVGARPRAEASCSTNCRALETSLRASSARELGRVRVSSVSSVSSPLPYRVSSVSSPLPYRVSSVSSPLPYRVSSVSSPLPYRVSSVSSPDASEPSSVSGRARASLKSAARVHLKLAASGRRRRWQWPSGGNQIVCKSVLATEPIMTSVDGVEVRGARPGGGGLTEV